jgi:hypothetical protein
MVLLPAPTVPESALLCHPCRLVSISYQTGDHFHGDNTGSNPVGDAKQNKRVTALLANSSATGAALKALILALGPVSGYIAFGKPLSHDAGTNNSSQQERSTNELCCCSAQ